MIGCLVCLFMNIRVKLREFFGYVKACLKDRMVVIVTPINPSLKYRIRKTGLSKYRRYLEKVGTEFCFMVIYGGNFDWDGKSVNSKEILWDGIHPTELGYRLYAENVYRQLMEVNSNKRNK